MAQYLHLFETEADFNTERANNYKEPWVSLTKRSDDEVKSFIGEYEYEKAMTVEQQFNYFGRHNDYVNTDIIESDITAIDGENKTITVDGYAFYFQKSQDNKYFFEYDEPLIATETVESLDGVIEFDGGTYSACTVSGRTFIMDYYERDTYYWDEVDITAGKWLMLYFSVDHETLTVGETVKIPMGEFSLLGYTSVEPAVGVLLKYCNFTDSIRTFISDNGKHVQVGDTNNGVTVKSIVEAEEGEALNRVDYNKTEYEKMFEMPLTFEALSNGVIRWKANDTSYTRTIEYKKNDGEWTSITSNTGDSAPSISVAADDVVQFRGNNVRYATGSDRHNSFSGTTCQFNVKGNIMSLIDSTGFATATTLANSYTFYYFFRDCTGLTSAQNLILPSTTLANYCYDSMFQGCTSLTTAPALPATTLASECYEYMFQGCTSLTTGPSILPATTLAYRCYFKMFGDTSITTAPKLPATTIAEGCYQSMFQGCTSLTTGPSILPATTLADQCYFQMFSGCTSLTTAPELPATTLAYNCYQAMFYKCTSLTTVPSILPATTLAGSCYYSMFSNCASLTKAPELPATTLAECCYQSMFYGCSSLSYIKCLATDISAIQCTTTWVGGVKSIGAFVKNPNMASWTTGTNGIPNNWTVVDATD